MLVIRRAFEWLKRRDLVTVVLLLIVAVGSWAFIELADEVLEGETRGLDRSALLALRSAERPEVPRGPAWLAEAMRDITALGSYSVLVLLIVAVAGFCLLSGDRVAMITILLAGGGGMAIAHLLKWLLHRPRPTVVPHLTDVATASFPSGHAMMSATVYLTLGVLLAQLVQRRNVKSYFVGVALLVTLLVGISRVYLGVHYPTDVLAGWTAGAVWAIVCGLLMRQLHPTRQPSLDTAKERR